MDSGTKQRVIGACVLTAIGVIFLPSLLQRPEHRVVDTDSQIPAKPEFTLLVPQAPTVPADVEPPPAPETLFVPQPLESETSETPAPEASARQPNTPAVTQEAPTTQSGSKTIAASNEGAVEPKAADNLIPDGFVIQVASFKESSRAQALVETLKEREFRAYWRAVTVRDASMYRVYVGPVLERADADTLKQRLDESLNADTLIMRFSP